MAWMALGSQGANPTILSCGTRPRDGGIRPRLLSLQEASWLRCRGHGEVYWSSGLLICDGAGS